MKHVITTFALLVSFIHFSMKIDIWTPIFESDQAGLILVLALILCIALYGAISQIIGFSIESGAILPILGFLIVILLVIESGDRHRITNNTGFVDQPLLLIIASLLLFFVAKALQASFRRQSR